MDRVFKIMSDGEWSNTLGSEKPYRAVIEADLRDGYLHCVAGHQVLSTLAMWYQQVDEALVVELDPCQLGESLRWEPGARRPEQHFPHIYGEIGPDAAIAVHRVVRGHDGDFVLPAAFEESGSERTSPGSAD